MDSAARVAIEHECIQLGNAFAHHLDNRNYQALADLFLPNGVWLRIGQELNGQAAIVAALQARPTAQFTRHLAVGHHFTSISEIAATSSAYITTYGSFDAQTLPAHLDVSFAMLLDCQDFYVRAGDGWRFAKRIMTLAMGGEGARAHFQKR